MLAGLAKTAFAASIFYIWWVLHRSVFKAIQSIVPDYRGFFVLPFLVVFALRFFTGWYDESPRAGVREVVREVRGLLEDLLLSPLRAVALAHRLTWIDTYFTAMQCACLLSHYPSNYGPVSLMTLDFVVTPCMGFYIILTHGDNVLLLQWLFCMFFWWQLMATVGHLVFHRYFAHRSFTTSRPFAFILNLVACASKQRGGLWWASTHRRHHMFCETKADPHCPAYQGFFYAHCGWIMDRDNFSVRLQYVQDWLVWHEQMIPDFVSLPLAIWIGSEAPLMLQPVFEWLFNVDLPRGFVAHAFTVGAIMSLHFVLFTNSMCHVWGHQINPETRLQEKEHGTMGTDISLDVHGHKQAAAWKPCKGLALAWVGLLNGGEGFHARHHEDAKCALHGSYWWQDTTYMTMCVLERFGLIWDVHHPSKKASARDLQLQSIAEASRVGGDASSPACALPRTRK